MEELDAAALRRAVGCGNLQLVTRLQKVISNIIDHPNEQKYRSLRLDNNAIQELVAVAGVVEFLQSAGFKMDAERDGFLCMPEPSATLLQSLERENTRIKYEIASMQASSHAPLVQTQIAIDMTDFSTAMDGLPTDSARLGKSRLDQLSSPALLIVVHCRGGDTTHAIEQVSIALSNGADGVFLIIHARHPHRDLIGLYMAVREAYPSAFIGLNFVYLSVDKAMELVPDDVQALWTDDGVDGKQGFHGFDASIMKAMHIKKQRQWQGLVFGAFAFKYRTEMPENLYKERGCLAAKFIDVPTTSGPGTGKAMTVDKARMVREAVGEDSALAVASGVGLENASDFRPYFNCFLVASSVEEPPEYSGKLIGSKIRLLANQLHGEATLCSA